MSEEIEEPLAQARALVGELWRVNAEAVRAAIPVPEGFDPAYPTDLASLEAQPDPAGAAFILRVLARVDPARTWPLAAAATCALLEKANEARLAYLRAVDPACVAEAIVETDVTVVVHEPDAPLGQRWVQRRLRTVAHDVDDAVALFSRTYDRWYAVWSLVGKVAQRAERGKRATMEAIIFERRMQAGATRAEEAAVSHARVALAECVRAIPFAEIVRLLRCGALQMSEKHSWAGDPALADPVTCAALLEEHVVFDPVAISYSPPVHLARPLLATLGHTRHAPAAPLLAKLLLTRHGLLHAEAAAALLEMGDAIGGAAVMDELIGRIDRRELVFDPHHPQGQIHAALDVVMRLYDDPWAALAPIFEPSRLSTGCGAAVALELLSLLQGRFAGRPHAVAALLERPAAPRVELKADARWASGVASLVPHRLLGPAALRALDLFEPAVRERAVADAAAAMRARRPRRTKGTGEGLLAKYEAGGHRATWDRIAQLDAAGDAALLEEIDRVAEATMRRVQANLETLYAALKKRKAPILAKAKALTPPKPTALADIAKLEKKLKVRLPAALRAFYCIVGAVDFSAKTDPQEPKWSRDLPGRPLVVRPLREAGALATSLLASKKGMPNDLRPPLQVYVAPDADHALLATRGDHEPIVATLGEGEDPPLEGVSSATFVAYLRDAFRGAGYVGNVAREEDVRGLLEI